MSGPSSILACGGAKIAIVDYGAGNLTSVRKAFDHLDAKTVVTAEPEVVASADKIVLPGVGHFAALGALENKGLHEACLRAIHMGKPFLGICLGMQWLFDGSQEAAEVTGAGIISGCCVHFPSSVKAPHVGWNSLQIANGSRPLRSRLLRGIISGSFVYFTHSFYAPVVDATAASAEYGSRFSAVVERDNVFGLQFHPEKSWMIGLQILRNFCEVV
jgi:imidazole glycerol-phosphate synthase subunit HisH